MIKLIISDFDGTLVDTFEANYLAYKTAFEKVGHALDRQNYNRFFGFRFERFMQEAGITDREEIKQIRALKGEYYPEFFNKLKVNNPLLTMIRAFRKSGGKTAIASTARRKNLENALTHINAVDDFDLILAGEDVSEGKPSPEIYLTVLQKTGIKAEEALVFEDSEVGIQAAKAAGINYIKINETFFHNGD